MFGFAYDDSDGRLHFSSDEAGRLLEAASEEAVMTAFGLTADQLQEFESRAEHLLKTGQRMPQPSYAVEVEPDYFEVVSVGLSADGIVGHCRLGGREIHVQLGIAEIAGHEYGHMWDLAHRLLAQEIVRFGADVRKVADVDIDS